MRKKSRNFSTGQKNSTPRQHNGPLGIRNEERRNEERHQTNLSTITTKTPATRATHCTTACGDNDRKPTPQSLLDFTNGPTRTGNPASAARCACAQPQKAARWLHHQKTAVATDTARTVDCCGGAARRCRQANWKKASAAHPSLYQRHSASRRSRLSCRRS